MSYNRDTDYRRGTVPAAEFVPVVAPSCPKCGGSMTYQWDTTIGGVTYRQYVCDDGDFCDTKALGLRRFAVGEEF